MSAYIGLKTLAHGMSLCGKDLTRACTIEKLRALKDFDTGGLSAPVSFDNPAATGGHADRGLSVRRESQRLSRR